MFSNSRTVTFSYFLSPLSDFVDFFELTLIVSCKSPVVKNTGRSSVAFNVIDPLFVLIHRYLTFLHLLHLDWQRPQLLQFLHFFFFLLLQLTTAIILDFTYAYNFKTYSRYCYRICSFSTSASFVNFPSICLCFSLDIFIFSFSFISKAWLSCWI